MTNNKQKLLLKVLTVSAILFTGLQLHAQEVITTNQQGTHDGFFFSFWEENGENQAQMTLGPEGNYSTTWNNVGNFTAGKGWAQGSRNRVVCFEGSYDGGSNGFLAVYGWTLEPLIEYYVVEDHGDWTPPGNTSDVNHRGTFQSDGEVYDIYTSTRTDKPSIIGTATFTQVWSVRQSKRSTGTVTFSNHVNEWESIGIELGTEWDYQIMESEGYGSSGSSNITVWECESCSADEPEVTPEVNYEINEQASPLTATGTNLRWYDSANSDTPLGSAPTPSTSTAGSTTYYVSQTPGDCESAKASITVNVNVPQGPYNDMPHVIPGTIQLEEFDVGGNGSAYYDDSEGSETDVDFRNNEDVDIEESTDDGGGYNIGWATSGEWLEYTVQVESAGMYDIELRVACAEDGRTVDISMDEEVIAGGISIPNTGDWQTWETITVNDVELDAGEQVMRLTIGSEDYVNMNYVAFTGVVTDITDSKSSTMSLYPNPFTEALTVQQAGNFHYRINDANGTLISSGEGNDSAVIGQNIDSGLYFITIEHGKAIDVHKIMKR